MSKKVVGIDLGTTFSAIAHINEYGKPEIIPNAESERITPSVIMFEDDLITVGKIAKQNAKAVPEQIVEFVKREMGKSKEEYFRTFNGKDYSAEELSALILAKLKQDAEAYLGCEVTDAVITVPAYFHDGERQATRSAGEIADLNVLQILNEPTAAALAYGMDKLGKDQNVFIFDLGGGTFDVTIMQIDGSAIKMLATNGDHRLGGKDWDDKIIQHVAEQFEIEHGENPLIDLYAYQELQLSAIGAKESLSQRTKSRIMCSYSGKSTRVELTREKFEELSSGLVERCHSLCEVVLTEAKMTWADIDTILLVGGATRKPVIREMVAEISGKEINPHEINPDEAVVLGAAIQGTLRQIVEEPTATADIPEAVLDKFIGENGQPKVTVTDGATHSLGLVILNPQKEQVVYVMMPKMTAVPCEVSDTFGTVSANQRYVLIEVQQAQETGEPPDPGRKLGECRLELPEGLPQGTPIHVTYKYNLDQTLEVTAKGPDGRIAQATIQRSTLSDEEVTEATRHIQELEVQ